MNVEKGSVRINLFMQFQNKIKTIIAISIIAVAGILGLLLYYGNIPLGPPPEPPEEPIVNISTAVRIPVEADYLDVSSCIATNQLVKISTAPSIKIVNNAFYSVNVVTNSQPFIVHAIPSKGEKTVTVNPDHGTGVYTYDCFNSPSGISGVLRSSQAF